MNKILKTTKTICSYIKYKYLVDNSSREKIEQRQQKLLKKTLRYIKKHSAFYRDATHLPEMNKQIMMDNFSTLNTVGIDKNEALDFATKSERTREFTKKLKNITVGLSSGTSGNQGIFLISDDESAEWKGATLVKTMPPKNPQGHKIAFFMRANSTIYEDMNSRTISWKYFDLYKPVAGNMKSLDQFQPTTIVSPPSMLLEIADHQKTGKINIHPDRITAVAEVLEEADKQKLKEVFHLEVIHQAYQCTEGFLGCTCKHGTLHLNEDMLIFEKEYLDEKRFIPIITDLQRRAQPFINYRLNDILVESQEECPCGSKLLALEKIEGRADDIFVFNGVKIFPDFIRRCILLTPEVQNYIVTQTSDTKIIVEIEPINEMIKKQVTKEFRKLATDMSFPMPNITFKKYQRDFSKKLKRVRRNSI